MQTLGEGARAHRYPVDEFNRVLGRRRRCPNAALTAARRPAVRWRSGRRPGPAVGAAGRHAEQLGSGSPGMMENQGSEGAMKVRASQQQHRCALPGAGGRHRLAVAAKQHYGGWQLIA